VNAVAKSRYKLLIVDDEHIIVDTFTLAEIFAAHNYEVRSVRTAEQVLKTISLWLPDVAIIDKMNGIDFAALLTRQCLGCGCLLFSNQRLTANLLVEAECKGCSFKRSH